MTLCLNLPKCLMLSNNSAYVDWLWIRPHVAINPRLRKLQSVRLNRWLKAGVKTQDICQQLGCGKRIVWEMAKMQSGGKAAQVAFMRRQISQLLDTEVELKEICRIVGCTPKTVYKVSRLKKQGLPITPKYSGTKRTVRTDQQQRGHKSSNNSSD